MLYDNNHNNRFTNVINLMSTKVLLISISWIYIPSSGSLFLRIVNLSIDVIMREIYLAHFFSHVCKHYFQHSTSSKNFGTVYQCAVNWRHNSILGILLGQPLFQPSILSKKFTLLILRMHEYLKRLKIFIG